MYVSNISDIVTKTNTGSCTGSFKFLNNTTTNSQNKNVELFASLYTTSNKQINAAKVILGKIKSLNLTRTDLNGITETLPAQTTTHAAFSFTRPRPRERPT